MGGPGYFRRCIGKCERISDSIEGSHKSLDLVRLTQTALNARQLPPVRVCDANGEHAARFSNALVLGLEVSHRQRQWASEVG